MIAITRSIPSPPSPSQSKIHSFSITLLFTFSNISSHFSVAFIPKKAKHGHVTNQSTTFPASSAALSCQVSFLHLGVTAVSLETTVQFLLHDIAIGMIHVIKVSRTPLRSNLRRNRKSCFRPWPYWLIQYNITTPECEHGSHVADPEIGILNDDNQFDLLWVCALQRDEIESAAMNDWKYLKTEVWYPYTNRAVQSRRESSSDMACIRRKVK